MWYGIYIYRGNILSNYIFVTDDLPFEWDYYCLLGLHLANIHDNYMQSRAAAPARHPDYSEYVAELYLNILLYHPTALFHDLLYVTHIDFCIHLLLNGNDVIQSSVISTERISLD